MPEFENVIMSKYDKMPVTLLLDNRHRNMTDAHFGIVKNYIRKLVDGEPVCSKCISSDKCPHDHGSSKCMIRWGKIKGAKINENND